MTRKDYALIAAAVRAQIEDIDDSAMPASRWGAVDAITDLSERIADSLATTNPRFDRTRFLKACGVN